MDYHAAAALARRSDAWRYVSRYRGSARSADCRTAWPGHTLMQERIGIIDLGSNTTRLVVIGYTPHHSFKLLDEVRETVRLAEGIGEDGQLRPAPMERGVVAMKMFRSFCKSTGVTRIVPV